MTTNPTEGKLTEAEIESLKASYIKACELAEQNRAKLHALESRLPDCPPCEMGENTACICDSQLVPKEWLDETVKEREALESQLKQAKEILEHYADPDVWPFHVDGEVLKTEQDVKYAKAGATHFAKEFLAALSDNAELKGEM